MTSYKWHMTATSIPHGVTRMFATIVNTTAFAENLSGRSHYCPTNASFSRKRTAVRGKWHIEIYLAEAQSTHQEYFLILFSTILRARKEAIVLLGNCSCVTLPAYIRVGVSVLCASARVLILSHFHLQITLRIYYVWQQWVEAIKNPMQVNLHGVF